MGFILILIFMTLIFGLLWYKIESGLYGFVTIIVGVITIVSIIVIPFSRYYSEKRIKEFETRKTVIEQQRSTNISEMERIALTKEILNDNTWLSNVQYDRSHIWFNIYYNKEVMNLTPIQ